MSFLRNLFRRRVALAAVATSETGSRRLDNQDSVLADAAAGFFAVADGMGGASDGAIASGIVCRRLGQTARPPAALEARLEAAAQALMAANGDICAYVRAHGLVRMGSTAAVLVFDGQDTHRAAVCHVGDSRVYRIRGGAAEALTRDHTVGRELGIYAADGRNEASEGDSRASRLNHVLTRAVGICDALEPPTTALVDVTRGDRFLVCSDGVHDVLSCDTIAMLAGAGTLAEAQHALSEEIVRCGAPDNYSFVLVGTAG